ncbi:MAG: hypothetical protein A2Y07_08335 [Planctomycetes bacterium GWF2_50_10]|nr:MAG: hypothetical protein A2Y07_08335 [Planctomycetes bacterium GWF2_50_10]
MAKSLCQKCNAMCCRYIALEIDEPETRDEFDDVRWYLTHEGVSVFVEKGKWHVSFAGSCRHIDDKHRCSIYETRPKICRKYKTDGCDRTSDEYDYELHFTNDAQMLEYMRVKFDNMKMQIGAAAKGKKKLAGKKSAKPRSNKSAGRVA